MYDVLYMAYRDGAEHRTVVATGLDREAACERARVEARKRNVGADVPGGVRAGPDRRRGADRRVRAASGVAAVRSL